MEVFVTGGSGLIGGHLIEALVRAGHAVSALARSRGHDHRHCATQFAFIVSQTASPVATLPAAVGWIPSCV
ncbi:NAD-dependent epimerase/dehydratase family protein [Sorangium sp. So ce269]